MRTLRVGVVRKVRGRRAVAAALACLSAVGIAACGTTPLGSGSGSKSAAIGFSGAKLIDPFQVVLVHNVNAEAKAIGLKVLPATNANADPAKQVTDTTTLLSQGIGGLILIPVDSSAVVPAVERANRQDVPVVTVDVAPTGGNVYMNVRADNYAMGRSACEEMGKRIKGKGTVLELQGDLASVNGAERSKGFKDCMAKDYPQVKVLSRPTKWEAPQAAKAAQAVVSTTDVAGVFMASDSVMGPGVAQVLNNLGKWHKVGEPGHVVTVSIDGTPPALRLIREGYQDALVSQPLDLYAKYTAQYIKDALAGKTYRPGPTDHGSKIVEFKGNLMDELPSPLVTKENVDDPALWGNKA